MPRYLELLEKRGRDLARVDLDEVAPTFTVGELRDLQVFYINIGGGEPMVRRDFFEIVEYCVERGVGEGAHLLQRLVEAGHHVGERVVDLVRHPGRERAEGGQGLRPAHAPPRIQPVPTKWKTSRGEAWSTRAGSSPDRAATRGSR